MRTEIPMNGHAVALALAGPEAGLFRAGNLFLAESVLSDETPPCMESASDAKLAERAVKGDADAFAELYRRYERPIFSFILRTTGRRTLAADLLQETFTRVWMAGRSFDPARGAFRPWLYRVALNTVRSELAKKRYSAEHLPIEGTLAETRATGNDPGERIDLSRQAQSVIHALDGLPAYLREVVVLRCYQQLTFAEISEITGAPEGTLKARFHRAVAALRSNLGVAGR
jgi:RNA polymerase sigma-70 factor (ECF subfamily)